MDLARTPKHLNKVEFRVEPGVKDDVLLFLFGDLGKQPSLCLEVVLGTRELGIRSPQQLVNSDVQIGSSDLHPWPFLQVFVSSFLHSDHS